MTRQRAEDWNEPEKLVLLQGWRMNGLTIEQIATNIGIGKTTIYEWMKKYPNIQNALKIGEEESVMIAENSLFKLVKKGNLGAIIFFLKNKRPSKWKDRHDVYSNEAEEITESFADKFVKHYKERSIEEADKE